MYIVRTKQSYKYNIPSIGGSKSDNNNELGDKSKSNRLNVSEAKSISCIHNVLKTTIRSKRVNVSVDHIMSRLSNVSIKVK